MEVPEVQEWLTEDSEGSWVRYNHNACAMASFPCSSPPKMKPSALSDQPSAEIESGNHDYSILLMADC
jgi:hypothetical protein